MIIRKPYAFFIKMFKPIHILMAILTAYLLYLENKMMYFFNDYINSPLNIVGQNIKDKVSSDLLLIIPAILTTFSIIILGVMIRKKKPALFYVVAIASFIAIAIINVYAISFLGTLEKIIVSIRSVKLIHDMVMIAIIISIVLCIFLFIRGLGVNIKKFNFDSEISKINIDESDKEEIELNLNIDLNESRRNRKRSIRRLRYTYAENKFLANIVISVVIFIILVTTGVLVYKANKVNKEGIIYKMSGFNYGVDRTIVLNTDYRENKITDNYLIVVDTKFQINSLQNKVSLNDFSLKIGDVIYKPTTRYSDSLIDIGYLYNGDISSVESNNYLFVYEIPEKLISSDMYFRYSNNGKPFEIKLNPKEVESNNLNKSKKITEDLSFEEILGNIKFKVNEYEIKKQFLIQYDYCVKANDCVKSKEYLRASIDKNYDKYILRLNLEYSDSSGLDLNSFYKFFSNFGQIDYYINNTWNTQSSGFEEIKSTRVSDKDNVYIGIKSEIANASLIKLVFNIRGSKYEYILKGEI